MAAAQSVADILNAAQDSRSEAARSRCAAQLWKLVLQDPDSTTDELLECVDYLMTISQKSPHVQLCIRFFGSFASRSPTGSQPATAAVEALLQQVAAHTAAGDKDVRQHACQLLHQLLEHLPVQVLQDDAVLDSVAEALTERLRDKLPAVRAEAVQALCDLTRFFEDAEDIIDDVTALLEGDKSKDVRSAVVLALPLTPHTLPVLLDRARDVSPVVRKKVAARLGGDNIAMLSILQRANILQKLLRDRDSSVAEAGRSMLADWLVCHCKGDPLQLLEMLDVETYTDAAVCALECLISSNLLSAPGQQQQASESRPSAIAYVRAAAAAGSGSGLVGLRSLCQQQGRLLEPHEALLWRCLCEWLQTDAISRGLAAAATAGARAAVQAAVAAERHEALEAALPESADDLMALIMRHTAAGPPARFAAAQLLTVAAKCMEWTDVASRDSAAPFLQQLIALDPTREFDPAAHMADDADADSSRGDDEPSVGLQLEGNGGDGVFEAAVVQLVAAMQGTTSGFVAAMLDGITDLAAAAGLLRKPDGCAGDHARFTVDAADTRQVLQVLSYACKMLQRVPLRQQALEAASRGSISFDSLWELLLLLALKSEHPAVRAKAVECVGAYAVVAAGSNPSLLTAAVSLLGPLLAAEGSQQVRAAAVRALADIAMLYGPAAVDSVLRRPAAATGAGAADSGADSAADSSGRASSSPKGLLELLVEQGQALLAEAQAGADKPAARKPGRPSTKAKAAAEDCALPAAAADLMAAVAETLAKLLLHQRVWLRHYPHSPTAQPAGSSAEAAAQQQQQQQQPVQLPPDSRQQQALLLQGALALLLQLQFHPATATVTQVCQRLSVFFDVFSAASQEHSLQLAAACLPAARQALHVRAKKQPAPLLAKYVLQLLQQSRVRREHSGDLSTSQQGAAATLLGESFSSVAHMLLAEVSVVWPFTVGAGKQPALYKPYLSALVKAVVELPLAPDAQDTAALQSAANSLSLLVAPGKDPTLAKDVAALQQHLQALAEEAGLTEAHRLPEQELQQLVAQYRALSLETLPALPDDIAEAAAAAAAAAKGAGGGGATHPAAASGGARSSRGRASAAAPVRGRGRGRPSGAARRVAAAASSSSSDGDSSSSSEEEDHSSEEGSSDAGGEDAPPAPAAARAGSRRVSAAAAAIDTPAAAGDDGCDSEIPDSEDFTTANSSEEGCEVAAGHVSSARGRGAPAVAAARPQGAGAVSELSDSSQEEEGSEGSEGSDSPGRGQQEEVPRAAAGSTQAGKAAVAAAARRLGTPRRPLAPSSAANRRLL